MTDDTVDDLLAIARGDSPKNEIRANTTAADIAAGLRGEKVEGMLAKVWVRTLRREVNGQSVSTAD
ncbi:hypothetical protein U8335_20370 [Roseiconus lacunae]|uniref:hypothetical protein n=1 Tax=Roseiconus lacunae TaxID=2605694 RepID=UPI003089A7C0|nr:hypothetical protein U8335_20370 [Stieleria sp. HD01]